MPENPPVDPRVQALHGILARQYLRQEQIDQHNNLYKWFARFGPYRGELYPKHRDFFRDGLDIEIRTFLAGNQIGKSTAGVVEDSHHLTGLYPGDWPGKRFRKPTTGWIVGETAKSVRDTIQIKLFGERGEIGTGIVPESTIIRTTPKHGLSDAFDTVFIRHVTGGMSKVVMKSYKEEVDSFRAAVVDFVHLDEEGSIQIMAECLTRIMTTNGTLYSTLTPMNGRTHLIEYLISLSDNRDELELS